ncbi:sugar phosphate isomerase/epimerase family protein [Opitutus terrae]|uniref:Xylose isomerase domain protein TIM barrel n=1 Tax=Opitutus terrae (strain DSM 11246 / JCM 15787 / PB90-1) TaxID=452637 RepID=B1ZXB1_OPITP|nr:sugar phosphate isomerase/epimerase family protein [Opitutus terrae]ACB76163.1 Xylose isomerase domain protein TIM barrel [Opitutus terrae PB90-1]
MPLAVADNSRLCLHTITTKPWPIETAAARYAAAGVQGITVWRDALDDRDPVKVGAMLRDSGLEVVSLCRGGFFPARLAEDRAKALDDNRRAIAEAHELGAPHIVLVCGAVPGLPLVEARQQIAEGIAALLPDCAAANVKLAIEPLHPMYADSRSAINTLGQANDLAAQLDSPWVGVAIDVYHLWWDPALEREIARCGRLKKILAYHVCDWRTPTGDLLLDRGLMGDGCIPLRQIRSWVEAAGFNGFNEVEIFSTRHWADDQDDFLARIVTAYHNHV